MKINYDCKHFRGSVPCIQHKQDGVHCDTCNSYQKLTDKILIVKLGAAGDVIRTTPLLSKINKKYPSAYIAWLTDFPDLIPNIVNEPLKYDYKNIMWLLNQEWDILYNLDKDKEAISLAEKINTKHKYGFGMDQYGHCRPFNDLASHKFFTGLFDDISKENKKNYMQEIFELCDFEFNGEKYIFDKIDENIFEIDHAKKIIGLNTGCGKRWSSRLWPDECWMQLAIQMQNQGHDVLWLGGPDEHEKNQYFQGKVGGLYLGYYPIKSFISLVNNCDILVTQVTMALHIGIGLGKRIVLMNNIFNKYEFELYGLGEIIEPQKPCGCYFTPFCIHDSMRQITPEIIGSSIERQLNLIG